jgi:hypothetical protein
MRVLLSTCWSRGDAAAELVAARFDAVDAAAEECDAPVATGAMTPGVWR